MEKNRKGKTKVVFHSRIMNRKNFEDDRPAREYGASWKEGRKEGRGIDRSMSKRMARRNTNEWAGGK